MKDFCIVGSGIAGSTIANLLSKKYSVEIFDKARGPGGRASNRRYKRDLSFDHGLQYISPKSKEFIKFISKLNKKKIIKKWSGNHLDLKFTKKINLEKYIGFKANNQISKYLLKKIKLNFNSQITKIFFSKNHWIITVNYKDKLNFKNLILTCPYPQLTKLAAKYLPKKNLQFRFKMVPNITTMLSYKHYPKIPISSIKFNDPIIAWASNENSKNRFKSHETLWTLQCTDKYSNKIINLVKKNKKKYLSEIIKRFEDMMGYKRKNLTFKNIHGWKFAYNKKISKTKSYWNEKKKLGICADWLSGYKAENSWLNANNLFLKIKKNPQI